MTDISGFKKYNRQLPEKELPRERVKHYKEFVTLYDDKTLNKQAARCMDCGIPFCHSGCPLGNVIPDFNAAVHESRWEEAYQILASTNNFPEFTGRICPAPCESACVLSINRAPVAIEEIEKHIIEIAFEKGYVAARPSAKKTGKRIAVVGSGPAGLAGAAQLIQAGHDVTVFEKDDRVGGLLQYGIPDFKLEKWVIDRRIQLMKEEGIEFRVSTEVGTDISISELMQYDAILLATGATVPREMPLPGRDLEGVHFAMDYLTQQNKRLAGNPISGEAILATDKDVIVIGSGDTGSDCVGTANRQGAKSVGQVGWKPMLPSERNDAMPWPTVPNLHAITSSHEEGVERYYELNTKAFIGDESGKLKAVRVVTLAWEVDELGRPYRSAEIPESEKDLPCDLALIALGFNHTEHSLLQELGVETDRKGNAKADINTYQTNVDKIFVAGDMRRGQSLVVWAISEGREAARKMDEFLMGYSELAAKDELVCYNT